MRRSILAIKAMHSLLVSPTATIPFDALASLAFGIIIVSTIRNMGVENPRQSQRHDPFWFCQHRVDGDHLYLTFLYGNQKSRAISYQRKRGSL